MTQNGNILNISVTRLWKKYRRLTQECMQICSPIRQVTYGFFFWGDTIDITLCEFKVYNMLTGYIYILQYSNWRQEEKGATEDEMVGGHHWLNGYIQVREWRYHLNHCNSNSLSSCEVKARINIFNSKEGKKWTKWKWQWAFTTERENSSLKPHPETEIRKPGAPASELKY